MKRALFLGFSLLLAAPPAWAGDPFKKGPWMQQVTPTSAVVRVELDPPLPVTLQVGMANIPTGAEAGTGSVIESLDARALHSIVVKGLEPGTRYPFTVRAGGTTRFGALTTAPREDSGASFRFLLYGDNRTDDAGHAAVVRAMVSSASDFLVNTGDMVANGGSKAQWQTFFDIEAPLTRERPIFATVGNHELVDGAGADYVRYFGPAEMPKALVATDIPRSAAITGIPLDAGAVPLSLDQLSGTFRWSNARFFLVNGMVQYTSGPTRAWLDKVLAEADSEAGLVWRIVVVHHGPWSSGPHGDNALLADAKIPELFRAHKIDIVLSGHDHIYERGSAGGMAYMVSGGGGAPVYRIKKAQPTSLHYEAVRHFAEATVSTSSIKFVVLRPDGSAVERCLLLKGVGWDCEGAKDADGGGVAGVSSGASGSTPVPSSRCGCRAAGADDTGRAGALSLLAGMALCAGVLARRAHCRSVR
jgi:hypothetical protein